MATSTDVDPYRNVVGQASAREFLSRAAADPTNAYLIVGPKGSGRLALARAFAADVLTRSLPADERARVVDLVLADMFADCAVFGAEGSRVRKEEAEVLRDECYRKPVDGDVKVVIGVGYDAITEGAAPILLKTIEEPGPSVVVVLLAEDVPPELITIASRCVRVNALPLSADDVRAGLALDTDLVGMAPEVLDRAAQASGGDLRRAKVLATDERFSLRLDAWAAVPSLLDGTGSVVSGLVADLVSMVDEALEPLEALLAEEMREADAEAERYGSRRETRKQQEERHKRILRAARNAEYRIGLAAVAGAYRDAAVAGTLGVAAATAAVEAIDRLAIEMVRSPNMRLQLLALFLDLPPVAGRV